MRILLGCWLCDNVDYVDHIDWLAWISQPTITCPPGGCALPLDSVHPLSPNGFPSWWPSGVPSLIQSSPTRSPLKLSRPLAPAESCSTDLQQTMVTSMEKIIQDSYGAQYLQVVCFADIRKWFHRRQLLRRQHQSRSRIWELKSSGFFRALQFSQCWWLATMWFDGSVGFAQSESHSLQNHSWKPGFSAKLASRQNQDLVKALLVMKASQTKIENLLLSRSCQTKKHPKSVNLTL